MNSADPHKQIPTIIESGTDSFAIMSVLGQGGMGTVYKARQEKLDRIVALKLLRLDHMGDRVTVQRLQIEAKAAAQVDHPNVVKVYSLGTFKEQPFLTMEYVEGQTLAELLAQRKTLSAAEAYNYFGQALEALRCIHEKGFLHRDIKPSNLMVTTDGIIKLMDFGIAKDLNSIAGQSMTQTSALLGSPQYMSPEQCAGQPLDVRTDIYSLGCSLYQALAGRLPFEGENQLEVMFKHLHQQADTLGSITDPRLAAVVAKALMKEREDRFQSASEFIEALHACQSGDYIPPRSSPRAKRSLISRRTLLVLLPAAAIALLAVIAFWNLPATKQEQYHEHHERYSPDLAVKKATAKRFAIESSISGSQVRDAKLYESVTDILREALATARAEHNDVYEIIALRELASTVNRFDADQAEKLYREAVELSDTAYRNKAITKSEHSTTYTMALSFSAQHRPANFRGLYDRAVAVINDESTPNSESSPAMLTALAGLKAQDYDRANQAGEYVECEKLAREAMELSRKAQGELATSAELAHNFVMLGNALRSQNKWDQVSQEMDRGIPITETGTDQQNDTGAYLFGQCMLAEEANFHLGNKNKCRLYFSKAMQAAKELLAVRYAYLSKEQVSNTMAIHAVHLTALGDPKAALSLSKRAIDMVRDANGKIQSVGGLNLLMSGTNLAYCLNDSSTVGLAQEAALLANQLGDLREGEALALAGSANYLAGHYEEAKMQLAESRALLDKSKSGNNNVKFMAAHYSGLTAVKRQENTEAAKWLSSAKTIFDADNSVLAPHLRNTFINEYNQAMTRNAP